MTERMRLTSLLRMLMCMMLLGISFAGFSQVDTYEITEMGYLRSPMEAKNGIILSNNRFSEIYVLKDNQLTALVAGRGCGIYTQMSKDKSLVGFKSINDDDMQAPAVLDVETGKVTLLEDYTHQCGQVSFSNDGTMAYTIGNELVIRKGENRTKYDLGFYTNIANISPDATKVAYSNIDGRMFIINLTNGVVEEIAVAGGYNGVWSPDGCKLAVHTANGTISVVDKSNDKIYDLGEGKSASWANNSEELIYTKVERLNELQISGSTIKKVNFDGSNMVTLVETSVDMPTDAILTSDNRLLVPYSAGERRGLTVRSLYSSVIGSKNLISAQETMLFSLGEDEFGARLDDVCDSKREFKKTPRRSTKAAMTQKIGALDIPYISQIYDVPSIDGCTRWGYVACAPSSACMFLGYFGLLDPVATTSRYNGTTKYYAWHIGNTYTNQAGNYTFDLTKYKYCATISGAYGYMWNTNTPQSNIENFMKLNGCSSAVKTYSGTVAWSTFEAEAAAGRPYMICCALGSDGHVILGFATNCKYRSSKGFIEQIGSFVCHDPYGDYNDSSWADGDGQHSTYDWVGYNNGQGNIGTYFWSCSAMPSDGSTPPIEPGLSVDKENITLTGVHGSSDVIYEDVKVTGEMLYSKISLQSSTVAVKVSKLSDWNDITGGTIRLTLNNNYRQGPGTYAVTVTASSGTESVEIGVSVTLTEGTNAVEDLNADKATSVEYYNLQGAKVNSPEKGVYIKREGAKASKVVL